MSKLGATGDFPEGKIVPHDEGGLQFAIGHYKGKVTLDFGKAVKWIALGPEDARNLAEILKKQAGEAERDYQ